MTEDFEDVMLPEVCRRLQEVYKTPPAENHVMAQDPTADDPHEDMARGLFPHIKSQAAVEKIALLIQTILMEWHSAESGIKNDQMYILIKEPPDDPEWSQKSISINNATAEDWVGFWRYINQCRQHFPVWGLHPDLQKLIDERCPARVFKTRGDQFRH